MEFVLCFSLFWVPLFLGLLSVGFALVQAIQVTQVCRDTGHMFAYGTNFAQQASKNLVASLAPGLNIDPTGVAGNGVVVLSKIRYIDSTLCQAGGYTSTSSCPNYTKSVVQIRIVIGNAAIHASTFATPTSSLMDSGGNIQPGGTTTPGYLNDPSTVAQNFSNVIALGTGQYAYVAETFVQPVGWSAVKVPLISSMSVF